MNTLLPLAVVLSLAAQPGSPGAAPGPGQPKAPPAPAAAPTSDVITVGDVKYRVETVVEKADIPWAITWDHTGALWFTERSGKVKVLRNGELSTVYEVKDLKHRVGAEVGLMGLELHPDFKSNGFVYIAYGHKTDNDVRVVRLKYDPKANALADDRIILKGMPAGPNHAGCALRFGPDGKLYITMGEMFQRDRAQKLDDLGGKIFRVNDDGSAPADNPFVNTPNARPEVWVYGVRNPQGIDWQPGTGRMFETEHGPSGELTTGGDELNFIEKGKNYGWPAIHHMQSKDGMITPLFEWSPAIAPGSGRFYTGDLFPQWKGSFLVGALRGTSIIRITLDPKAPDGASAYKGQERILTGFGRIRAVATGPDGAIYFSTSNKDGRGRPAPNDDRICRIVPAK
ncbi:MAG: PQQ-dependent sugar dehydrogenase [Phycisphaeraceae bacterium]|nr:PQQ-dependent sugar dehydrogenase [Phycisphaeraceae bacterium]